MGCSKKPNYSITCWGPALLNRLFAHCARPRCGKLLGRGTGGNAQVGNKVAPMKCRRNAIPNGGTPLLGSREETIMKLCRSALRLLGAALIIGLGFISGAFAQSSNPIRIGMKLARTRAGAHPTQLTTPPLLLSSYHA